jgi:hypothetical protein
LGWRLLIDFLKPQPVVAGMNAIQWACVIGLLALGFGALPKKKSMAVEETT